MDLGLLHRGLEEPEAGGTLGCRLSASGAAALCPLVSGITLGLGPGGRDPEDTGAGMGGSGLYFSGQTELR